MSYQADREEFVALMSQEGVPHSVARLILRHAATLQRIAVLECSSEAADRDRVLCPAVKPGGVCLCEDYGSKAAAWHASGHGTVPRIAVREHRTQRRLSSLVMPYRIAPVFSGDPRGAVVKLTVPSGKTNDWGQTGICVPTRE